MSAEKVVKNDKRSHVYKSEDVKNFLVENKTAIESAIPSFLNFRELSSLLMTEIRETAGLLECTLPSLLGSLIQASQLKLRIGNKLGLCYLVPYWNSSKGVNECQFQFGYQGLMELGWRSGHVTMFHAQVVRPTDEFDFQYGTNYFLHHKPDLDSKEDIIATYTIVGFKSGEKIFIVLSKKDIDEARAMSKMKNSFIWNNHYEAMAMKTGVRRIGKFVPKSPDLQTALYYEDLADRGVQNDSDILKLNYEIKKESRSEKLGKEIEKF